MGTKFSSGRARQVYEFMRAQRHQYDVRLMCRVLEVTPSGYYAWLKQRQSHRAAENARLLKLIRASFNASNGIYGSPRVFLDLREVGETCSKHRVARLMRENKIRPARAEVRCQAVGARCEYSAAAVRCRQTEQGLGYRHYLHPNLGRLAVPGCHHGSVLEEDRRLGCCPDYRQWACT
jgi:hypothetical protein